MSLFASNPRVTEKDGATELLKQSYRGQEQQSDHISQTPVELVAADGWFPVLTPLGDASVKVHTRALTFTCIC